MSRIVLFIEHTENRRLLAEWLSTHHEVATPDSPASLGPEFDLGIVDGPSLERYGRWIDAVRTAVRPLFLPFLLVVHRHGVGAATGHLWERVDELLITPVEKLELHARVETLLRARTLSLANASLARRLETELARAREVQAGLLPREAPTLCGYELAARCVPAREIGGDFFDWQVTGDAAVLSVGDVMGKGIPAALLAATVRAVLRALAHQNPPGAALDLLRTALSADLERTSSFVTLFHARLASSEVRYVDAGHGHAIVRRATGRLERLERGGRPVGFPAAGPYRESALRLDPGDALFVYSDGLFEGSSRSPADLIGALDTKGTASALVDDLVARAPRQETVDDVTVLVLKCTNSAA
jgi:serine phosphatase RsbU (regulator of sigma subunit)